MFDFNNDGKITPDEDFIPYNIYNDTSDNINYSKSKSSFGRIIISIIIVLLVLYIIGKIGNSSTYNSTSYKGNTSRSSYSSMTASRPSSSQKNRKQSSAEFNLRLQ